MPPRGAAALAAFAGSLPDVAPAAFAYQGYAGNRAMFGITVERVSQAIVGELTVEEAVEPGMASPTWPRPTSDGRVQGDEVRPP
jgi:hypothetical protein